MTIGVFGAAVVRTWSYYGGSNFVQSLRGAPTCPQMPMNDCEVGTAIETRTGLKTPPLRWVVMAPAQMASALLPEVQAEAEK